jgi:Big-like domain-containing protein
MVARRVYLYLRLILGAALALAALPVASASAALVMEAFAGPPTTHNSIGLGPRSPTPPKTFNVAALTRTLTLDQPASPSNNRAPSFSGTASTENPIVVHVFEGAQASGTEVATASGSGSPGAWSSGAASPELAPGVHTYTAAATQLSASGILESNSVTFTVDTLPPTVTLDQPASPSGVATPSFSGTASDTTPVTVDVYRGPSAGGNPIAALKVQGTGGSWASGHVSPRLADGKYTALATQTSSVGNAAGVSNSVTFEVDTRSPTVTLKAPPSPSNDTTPSFSGTASEATQVTVEVFEGKRPEGNIVATVIAPGTGGGWTSGPVAPALARGRHTFTALAIQTSALKNPPGRSAPVTFVVDTEPPTLALKAPPSPSNDTTPSFSGTASEATQVTVEIFAGPHPEGNTVATAMAAGTGGGWTSSDATPALSSGTFTAIAIQPSAIGNSAGESNPVTFTIDTSPPTVTLNALPSPSGNAAPSFSGTASDHTPVTVNIYMQATAEGAVVASATAEVDRGEWTSAKASPTLPWGEYTAVARQPSSIGNPSGASAPVTFVVAPIAPTVTTEAASEVTRTSAALYASVNPAGGTVSACNFEYGTTRAYGKSVECGFVSELGAFPPYGTAVVPVFARIYGLTSSTAYHYRIVAVGEGGAGDGADQTFTTVAARISEGSSGGGASQGGSGSGGAAAPGGVAAFIARQLKPRGRTANIASLLGSGVFSALFKAPGAGTAVIHWYYLPPQGKRAGSSAPSPRSVAHGSLTLRAAGTAVLKLHLTGFGKHLLRESTRIRLTATCVFTPVGARTVRTSRTFELRR